MKQLFLPETDPGTRKQALADNATSYTRDAVYFVDLDEDEINVRKSELVENLVEQASHDKVLTEARATHKEAVRPLLVRRAVLLQEIKTGKSEQSGMLYNLADHDAGVMQTYDENGVLVNERRLRPDEKQTNIFSIQKEK